MKPLKMFLVAGALLVVSVLVVSVMPSQAGARTGHDLHGIRGHQRTRPPMTIWERMQGPRGWWQSRLVGSILGKADNPLPTKVNAVLLLKTYHEVAQPITLLRNMRPSLTAGAKVGVIDRNGNGENHGVARDIVIREANELATS